MRARSSLAASLALVAISGCAPEVPATTSRGWTEVAYLKASRPADGEQSGYALALSADGGTLAVAAPMNSSRATGIHDGDPGDTDSFSSGAVRVFVRGDAGWSQQRFIKASNTGLNDQFGSAVALSGDGNTLAVSAVFEDGGGTGIDADGDDNSMSQSGAVYLFSRSGEEWYQAAYLKASNTGDAEDGDSFGYAISLSDDGNTLAVGAPGEDSAAATIDGDQTDNAATGSGAVYVFARREGVWSQEAYVKTSHNAPNVLFGYAVALDAGGTRLAASAYDEDRGRGAVYLFTREGVAWSEEVRLQASNAEPQDSMGVSLAISDDGETVAVGAPDEDSLLTGVSSPTEAAADQEANTSAGAVYVFALSDSTWRQQAFIKASNTGLEDWFGIHLALSGDGNVLAASAPNEDSRAQGIGGIGDDDAADEAGAVYVYRRNGLEWTHEADLKGSNTQQFDEFGSALALDRDGTTMAAGARFEDGDALNPAADSGAVYIFGR